MKSLATFISLSVLALFLAGCTQSKGSMRATDGVTQQLMEVDGTYGATFTLREVVVATELTERFGEQEIADTVRTTLRGQVNEVCQAKGCWMTIATGTESEMMVKFKDYAFFMPKDISGREVVMDGMAYYQITPIDELRHYAEDAGKSAEEVAMITEPKRELRFLADGVQLLK